MKHSLLVEDDGRKIQGRMKRRMNQLVTPSPIKVVISGLRPRRQIYTQYIVPSTSFQLSLLSVNGNGSAIATKSSALVESKISPVKTGLKNYPFVGLRDVPIPKKGIW